MKNAESTHDTHKSGKLIPDSFSLPWLTVDSKHQRLEATEKSNLSGSVITVRLTDLLSILFGFNCFAFEELKHFYLFGQIQTSKTGGQLYSDISPYGECAQQQLCHNHKLMCTNGKL